MASPITDAIRAQVRSRMEGDMVDEVLVQRGDAGTFDPTTGVTTGMTNAVTVYQGKARLPKVSPSGDISLGDGEIPSRQVECQIPWDSAPVFINDVVSIVTSIDPQLAGSTWRVAGVDGGGSFMAFRTLSLVGWYSNQIWQAS